MDQIEKEEAILADIVANKQIDAVLDSADHTHSNESESDFHDVYDALCVGLGKKNIWTVQIGDDWDTALFAFFIGKNFEQIKQKVEVLPDCITQKQVEAVEYFLSAKYSVISAYLSHPASNMVNVKIRMPNMEDVPDECKFMIKNKPQLNYHEWQQHLKLPNVVEGVKVMYEWSTK
jgi:hypothetical protein